MSNKKLSILFVLTAALLSACGGGESSSQTVSNDSAPTWIQGVFASESNFKNRCEAPRTGIDINGDSYTDQTGSKLYEKHWLRSWSNNTYLWYDEIVDSNPATTPTAISEPEDYFSTLKTTALTTSGRARDRFHFAQDTTEYQQQTSGGATLSYGARLSLLSATPPREARIAYIEPNSPAAAANLSRGAEIITIDGVNFVNGADTATLNAGLFPKTDGETHTFIVRDLGQTDTRTVVLQAQVVTSEPVKGTRVINTPSGKVAYLALNTFGTRSSEAALVNAFTQLAAHAPDDLVIDLRYNGGGFLAISAQLGHMIAGSALSGGRVFEKTVFNSKHKTVNPVTGEAINPLPFIDQTIGFSVTASQSLPSLNLNRVFVLSSGSTCSASESLINGLRGIDVDVVLIGGTTCGKPYAFYSTDNCGVTYSTIQFRGENEKGFGDYADGFSPINATGSVIGERIQGCQVTEDILHPLGDEQEIMLKAALDYRETGLCPAVVAERGVAIDVEGDLRNDPRIIRRELLEQIRMDNLRLAKQ